MWHVKVLIDEEFEQFIALAAQLIQIFFFHKLFLSAKVCSEFPLAA